MRLVRILRSTVMVRVGGGWVALDEFLVKNDPCRGMHHATYTCCFSSVQVIRLMTIISVFFFLNFYYINDLLLTGQDVLK